MLAGVSIFERQAFFLSRKLDAIAARFDARNPSGVELHGSPMLQGRGLWKSYVRAERTAAIADALAEAANWSNGLRLFGVAIHKASYPDDPMHLGFEQVCSRFDMFLKRRYREADAQRGMIIFDKSTYEGALQSLTADFRTSGHRYGILRNLAEVPLFLDSRTSRMIQLADLVAFALYRHFERGDDRFYRIIQHRFDRDDGRTHGLVHMFKQPDAEPAP